MAKSNETLENRNNVGTFIKQVLRSCLKINITPIERVDNLNFLGLMIIKHRKWDNHIDKIAVTYVWNYKFIPVLLKLYNSL